MPDTMHVQLRFSVPDVSLTVESATEIREIIERLLHTLDAQDIEWEESEA